MDNFVENNVVTLEKIPPTYKNNEDCQNCDFAISMQDNINKALIEIQTLFNHKHNGTRQLLLGKIDELEKNVTHLMEIIPDAIEKAAEKGGKSALENIGLNSKTDGAAFHRVIESFERSEKNKDCIKIHALKWIVTAVIGGIAGIIILGFNSFIKSTLS